MTLEHDIAADAFDAMGDMGRALFAPLHWEDWARAETDAHGGCPWRVLRILEAMVDEYLDGEGESV